MYPCGEKKRFDVIYGENAFFGYSGGVLDCPDRTKKFDVIYGYNLFSVVGATIGRPRL